MSCVELEAAVARYLAVHNPSKSGRTHVRMLVQKHGSRLLGKLEAKYGAAVGAARSAHQPIATCSTGTMPMGKATVAMPTGKATVVVATPTLTSTPTTGAAQRPTPKPKAAATDRAPRDSPRGVAATAEGVTMNGVDACTIVLLKSEIRWSRGHTTAPQLPTAQKSGTVLRARPPRAGVRSETKRAVPAHARPAHAQPAHAQPAHAQPAHAQPKGPRAGPIKLYHVGGVLRTGDQLVLSGGRSKSGAFADGAVAKFSSVVLAREWEQLLCQRGVLPLPRKVVLPTSMLFDVVSDPYMHCLQKGMRFRITKGQAWQGLSPGDQFTILDPPTADSDGEALMTWQSDSSTDVHLAVEQHASHALVAWEMINPHAFKLCTPHFCPACTKGTDFDVVQRERGRQERVVKRARAREKEWRRRVVWQRNQQAKDALAHAPRTTAWRLCRVNVWYLRDLVRATCNFLSCGMFFLCVLVATRYSMRII